MGLQEAFSRTAVRLNDGTQRWIPGAFTIAWILTLLVLALAMTVGRASFTESVP